MNRLLVAAIRFCELLVCGLPPRSLPVLAWVFGTGWYAVDRRRRMRCRANLRAAFGEGSELDNEETVRAVFRNMARVPLESLWFPRLFGSRKQGLRRLHLRGELEEFETCAPQGGLMLGGHLGNWEIGAQILRLAPVPLSVVVRRFAQAAVEQRMAASRGGDQAVIPHDEALGRIRSAFRERRWVGVVGDQNAGWRAPFVPFFGLPASTAGATVALALNAGVPIFFGATLRRGSSFRFDVYFERLDPSAFEGSRREAVHWVLARYMEQLEAWVRTAPTQYNWLHRRWKSRPPGEPPNPRLPKYDHHRVTEPAAPS